MKNEINLSIYEEPQISVVEFVPEQPILSTSDPTVTNPDMGWDD